MRRIGSDARNPAGAARSAAIKGWAREELGLGEDVTVTVSELACTEIGCPPIETVVTVYAPDQDPFLVKVPKPIAEMERFDLLAGLAFGGDHG